MCAQILALLEADENWRQVVESLDSTGHTTVNCKNYKDAIRILQRDSISLIVSDVHLENGGSVFDFLKWVRSNSLSKTTPFVMLSCSPSLLALHVEDGVRTAARLLGASKYISMRVFDAEDFQKQIESLIPRSVKDELLLAAVEG